MPAVYPFRAVQFKKGGGAATAMGSGGAKTAGNIHKEAALDVSSAVAPPYDVLNARSKQALLMKDQHNIVAIDLPHVPPKELGPPEAYESAAAMYRAWFANGTLWQQPEPAMFAYRQSFRSSASAADGPIGKPYQRCGMCCTVETVPFGPRQGGGILPHEETFSGPKEDRMALMRATKAQLSPIFGLFADEDARATELLHSIMEGRVPDLKATTAQTGRGGGSVLHEVWAVRDESIIRQYQEALAGEDVFIADGHHRYSTGLNYLRELEEQDSVDPDHPARRCMIVLVGMSDPGLVIWPTHRVLGGMRNYSLENFLAGAEETGLFDIRDLGGDLTKMEPDLFKASQPNTIGLFDYETRKCFLANPRNPDALAERFPEKPPEWRQLDVSIIQHMLVEQICEPKLNAGDQVKRAFPHTVDEVLQIGLGHETGAGGGAGFKAQLAVIVRPTPLEAVRAVSGAGELMPQKSTFFYPKLATGLFIHSLEEAPEARAGA